MRRLTIALAEAIARLAPSAQAMVAGPNGLIAFRANTGSGDQTYPDGQRIFYEGYNGRRRDDIWSMSLAGTDRRLITGAVDRAPPRRERPLRPVQDPTERDRSHIDHVVLGLSTARYGLGLGELMHP